MNAPIQSHNQKAAAVWSSGGSGYNLISSRAVARNGAKVIGVDIAADLLAAATARAAAEGLDEYRLGDAENLPFADGEFDAVISTCGVMFATLKGAKL